MQRARESLRRCRRYSSAATTSPTATAAAVSKLHQLQMDQSSPSPPASERYAFNPKLRWNPEVEEYFSAAYGAEHFARISKALTLPSKYSCIRVNTLKSTTGAVIKKLIDIVQGKLLESSNHDLSISESNKSDQEPESLISICKFPGLDYVLFLKGSGPHVIKYEDTPFQPLKEVIVSRKCAEAVLRGAQVFVPGVFACSAHVEKGDVVAVSAAIEQPDSGGGWSLGITRGKVLQGSESDPQYHERNGLYIGQGITLMSRAGMFRASKGVAVQMINRVYELPSLNDVLEGEVFLQNLPSIVTVHALDPQPGERILDMCAAPGGKTTAIAVLMKDKGEIVAIDRSHNKVMEILNLSAEMGLTCIRAYKHDALRLVRRADKALEFNARNCDKEASNMVFKHLGSPTSLAGVEITSNTIMCCSNSTNMESETIGKADERIFKSKTGDRKNGQKLKNGPGKNQKIGGKVEISKGYESNTFDRVLLDAPCSALGLRPRLFAGEVTMNSLKTHAIYQRRMFDQAVQLVRPGGTIVYSTCTINPGENEGLVRYALDKYKFLTLASQHPRVGGPGLVGRCKLYSENDVEEWLTPNEAELVQRFDPSSALDTIGFFIAKFNVGQKHELTRETLLICG